MVPVVVAAAAAAAAAAVKRACWGQSSGQGYCGSGLEECVGKVVASTEAKSCFHSATKLWETVPLLFGASVAGMQELPQCTP